MLGALIARRPAAALDGALEQALTIVYRILFLLFAEARGLVPLWHPIYRESYSLDGLRAAAEHVGSAPGLWDGLRAISRLAHAGCRVGDLRVTPFNGRLFSPSRTPLAERQDLDDEAGSRALLALATRATVDRAGRERIAYRDLGVEQLGAVYETVLDYEPRIAATPGSSGGTRPSRVVASMHLGSARRKATGTFYTPQPIAQFLIRRTLGPLVQDAAPEKILGLKVLDPAMGSGAFLVAACIYLAHAYEAALVRSGSCHATDFGPQEHAAIRRTIAERCLFGVDSNPMAVQLACLSLWLATLAADRPLTFLDHHLQAGDSLLGTWLVVSQPATIGPPATRSAYDVAALRRGGDRRRHPSDAATPLHTCVETKRYARAGPGEGTGARLAQPAGHGHLQMEACRESVVRAMVLVAGDPDACVRVRRAVGPDSDRVHGAPARDGYAVSAPRPKRSPPHAGSSTGSSSFQKRSSSASGARLAVPGFDAVITNPPWEMIRADAGSPNDRERNRLDTGSILRFTRDSGVYRSQSDGHPNQYQLFTERAVALTRPGGRMGLVLPAGLAADHGSAPLRRLLLSTCAVDGLVGFDNQQAVFPIHRSTRFLLLTATSGAPTTEIGCRLGEHNPSVLETADDEGHRDDPWFTLRVTPALLHHLSGRDLAIPELRTPTDLVIAERAAALFPPLGDERAWAARFGRELNATDDRTYFRAAGRGQPIVEGRQIEPFRVNLAAARHSIRPRDAQRLLASRHQRARLAYRDVASATNRVTLIAAVLPPDCVSTHTVFCLRTGLPLQAQHFLCGVFNSLIVNYLVRLRVGTHVTTAIVERLPVPQQKDAPAAFTAIAATARQLGRRHDPAALARLNAQVARLYQLSREEFEHVVGTFPLIPRAERDQALREFLRVN